MARKKVEIIVDSRYFGNVAYTAFLMDDLETLKAMQASGFELNSTITIRPGRFKIDGKEDISLLCLAARMGKFEMIKFLLDCGPSPDHVNSAFHQFADLGWTKEHWPCPEKDETIERFIACATLLLDASDGLGKSHITLTYRGTGEEGRKYLTLIERLGNVLTKRGLEYKVHRRTGL